MGFIKDWLGSDSISGSKNKKGTPLPPAAIPPIFANPITALMGNEGKKRAREQGAFGGTVKNEGGQGGLAPGANLAKPSLLG